VTVQKTKKLKRIGLLGMAQTPKHSVFRLEKKRHTVDAIRAFLQTIGFASWDSARLYSPLGGGDMGRPERKYTSTAYDDKYFSIPKGQYTVDVFFGKRTVVLSIYTVDDDREALKTKLLEFCDLKEAEKQ